MTNAAAEAAISIVILLNMNSSSVNWGARLARFCCGPALYPPVRAMVQHGSSLTSIGGVSFGGATAGAIRPRQGAAFCRHREFSGSVRKTGCAEAGDDPANQAKWMVLVST
jgi:hypothetical protein